MRARFLRRLALWVGLPLVVLALLLVFGIPIPLGPFRGPIESAASEVLGGEVRVGSAHLVLGIHPGIVIEDLRLVHTVEGRPDVVRVERADLELSVLALPSRRLHVRHAIVRGVGIELDPEAFPSPASEPEIPDDESPPSSAAMSWTVDVDRLSIENVGLVIRRPDAETTRAELALLSGRIRWNESVELALVGSYNEVPIEARIEGASPAALLAGTRSWPLALSIVVAGSRVEFESKLVKADEVYRVDDIQGRVGAVPVSGSLALEDLATRPRVRGRIEVGAIELELPDEPDAAGLAASEGMPAGGDRLQRLRAATRRAQEGPSPVEAFLGMLHAFETDLELAVERIGGLGPTIEDLAVALRIADGRLLFPVSMNAAEIPLAGTLRIDEVEERPHVAFELAAESFRVDTLAGVLAPEAEIRGSFEKLRVGLEGRADSLLSFLTTLHVELEAVGAALTYGVERPVAFGVERLELELAEPGPLTLRAHGDLLGEAVALELTAGGLMESVLYDEPSSLNLRLQGAGARVALEAELSGSLIDPDVTATLRISGERLTDLEPWLGTIPFPDSRYEIVARVEDTAEQTRVDLEEVSLGETKLVGDLGARREADGSIFWASFRIEALDLSRFVAETSDEPPTPSSEAEPETEAPGFGIDAPILPGGLRIEDADFDVGIGRFVAGALELEEVGFRGSFREGFLPASSFGFQLAGQAFAGAISLDLREPPHQATFEFGSEGVDVGAVLARLGMARGAEIRAGGLHVEVRGEGADLGEIFERSEVTARLDDVRWVFRDPHSDARVDVVLSRADLTSGAGDDPIRLVARGAIDRVPVRVSVETMDLSFFRRATERVPVTARLEMAGATLDMSSSILLPLDRADLEGDLSLTGRNLADASELLGYELPPVGPYRLASHLNLTRDDYQLSDLSLEVGRSRLRGKGRLDTRGRRARLDAELTGERIQLDDFAAAFEGAGGTEGSEPAAEPDPAEAPAPAAADADGDPLAFLSPEGLGSMDGRVVVRVAEVLSGKDALGSGELVATLEKGRLRIDPLHIDLPGGPFDLELEYAFAGRNVAARIRAYTERLDYSVLARRVDPETDMAGWLSLDLEVDGEAPAFRELLAHANGHLDFLAAPVNIDTDVFDLWAVNLLSFILPRLDSTPRSTLNCVVARFDLKDGVMEEKALLLDTTGMVVNGHSTVDFRDERIRLRLTPEPKQAEFLSLQTAVEVNGSFEEFRWGVPPEELIATVLRFVTSVVVVPIQRIFGGQLPADGEETCLAAWRKASERQ